MYINMGKMDALNWDIIYCRVWWSYFVQGIQQGRAIQINHVGNAEW